MTADPTNGTLCHLNKFSKTDQERLNEKVENICFTGNSSIGGSQCIEQSNSTVFLFPGQLHTIRLFTASGLGEHVRQPIVVQVTNNMWQLARLKQVFSENYSEVSLSIASNDTNTSGVVLFSVDNAMAEISVQLMGCPIGFSLDEEMMICQCSSFLTSKTNIKCKTVTGLLIVPATEWIGVVHNDTLAFVNHCLPGYCVNSPITIQDVKDMCIGNHAGVSCGQCKDGYSTVFGDTACSHCSNWYILTAPLFAVAGILLIVGIFALDLTISRGTVIGPIFLSNLFLASHLYSFNSVILSARPLLVWVSLMGLGLGFPLCFFDGMTALQKTMIEFVFPAFIISTATLIVILSRFFQQLRKLTSRHPVNVLATILFLSYGKVLKTIFILFQYNTLVLANGRTNIVWIVDGSVSFFEGWHAVACVFALVVLIVAILPYTTLLLFSPFLERFRVMVKLKPFIKAHSDPYKDKYQWWLGLRLAVIFVLTALAAAARVYRSYFLLIGGLILIIFLAAEASIRPYKINLINYFDLALILPLILGITGSLALKCLSETRIEVKIVSIFITLLGALSFIAFCGIMIFHMNEVFKILKQTKKLWYSKRKTSNQMNESTGYDNVYYLLETY